MSTRYQLPRVATVFGGTGFIGHSIIQRLAGEGYTVRVPTRHPASPEAESLRVLGTPGQIIPYYLSFKNQEALAATVKGSEVVINLLGILHERKRGDFFRIHRDTARQIAAAATEHQVKRLLHVSALGVSKDHPSRYARSKAEGEEVVRSEFPKATIFQPSVVFGLRDQFFNRFADMTGYSFFLPLIGGGKTKFQPVYVGDVADALLASLHKTESCGNTYQLGGPDVLSFKELMQQLLRGINRRRLLLPVPWSIATMKAAFLGLLPSPPLTVDQVRLLRRDNTVEEGAKTLVDLNITPTSISAQLPHILKRFGAKIA